MRLRCDPMRPRWAWRRLGSDTSRVSLYAAFELGTTPMISVGSLGSLWDLSGISLGSLWDSLGSLWDLSGNLMQSDAIRCNPMQSDDMAAAGFSCVSLYASGIPLGFLWDSSGIPLGFLWDSSGIPLGFLWDSSGIPLLYCSCSPAPLLPCFCSFGL